MSRNFVQLPDKFRILLLAIIHSKKNLLLLLLLILNVFISNRWLKIKLSTDVTSIPVSINLSRQRRTSELDCFKKSDGKVLLLFFNMVSLFVTDLILKTGVAYTHTICLPTRTAKMKTGIWLLTSIHQKRNFAGRIHGV